MKTVKVENATLRFSLESAVTLRAFSVALIIASAPSGSIAAPVVREEAARAAMHFVRSRQSSFEAVAAAPDSRRYLFAADTEELQPNDLVPGSTETGDPKFWIANVRPQGFLILGGDDRLPPIFGYSTTGRLWEADGKAHPLVAIVTSDVERRLAFAETELPAATMLRSNSEAWARHMTELPTPPSGEVCGPWLTTNWYQGGRFNRYCPLAEQGRSDRRLVGCVATAMAQVINYWKYPSHVAFDDRHGDAYLSWRNGLLHIDQSADTYDFPTFKMLSDALTRITYSGDEDEEAYLSFAAGVSTRMSYGEWQSGTHVTAVAGALRRKFGYGSARTDWLGYFRLVNVWERNRRQVIENMKRGWPVIIGVLKSRSSDSGHAIVVDGYDSSTDRFHLNLGWRSTDEDVWYDLPSIGSLYSIVTQVVYDIAPFPGWPMWGADSRNTFRSPYDAPSMQPARKWSVEVPETLGARRFDDLVIGTGGEVYASVSPQILGSNDHPLVCVVESQGTMITRCIEVSDSNLPINYLAQDKQGRIFFATGDQDQGSRVYRVEPMSGEVTRIFEHATPDKGIVEQPLKIGSDGTLYLAIGPRNLANSAVFYAVRPDGSVVWRDANFPPATGLFESAPAVDEDRNRVYLTYYNPATQQSHLICNSRLTGNRVFTYTFAETHWSDVMASTPQLLEDGSVIVGCRFSLFRISSQGVKLWEARRGDGIWRPPQAAISSDGTIYSRFGRVVGERWHGLYLLANRSSTGATKWDLEVAVATSPQDTIEEVYTARNGLVLVSYEKDDMPRLAAIEDQGNRGSVVWDVPYGGRIAFGPGETIYLVPRQAEASIYALSSGEPEDPNGQAMNFHDNAAPTFPYEPVPADGAVVRGTTVELAWSGGDPDGQPVKYTVSLARVDPRDELLLLPIVSGVAETSVTVAGLRPASTYLWSVTMTDGQAVTEGPTWSFRTKSDRSQQPHSWRRGP